MNEKIRELAFESANGLLSFDETGIQLSENEVEKFAELIVRECMDNLAWHGHDDAVSQLDWFLHHKIRS